MWIDDSFDDRVTRFFELSARALLSIFILVVMLAILAGTGRTLYDLRLVLGGEFHATFKTILVDMLSVLALVEVLRTALAYFTEGRVKVTYIIDTVLVTVLTEVMAFWYREMEWEELGMLLALVVSLACVRIVAVRFSPRRVREEF
jgi:uncharacterized membrane protein (DUF373 family)